MGYALGTDYLHLEQREGIVQVVGCAWLSDFEQKRRIETPSLMNFYSQYLSSCWLIEFRFLEDCHRLLTIKGYLCIEITGIAIGC